MIDVLMKNIEEEKMNIGYVFHSCKLENNAISSTSNFARYPDSQNGIVKLQEGLQHLLSE